MVARSESPGAIAWGEVLLGSASPMLAMGAILNFAPVLPLLQQEFGLTNTWSGALISATVLTHTLLMIPGGQIADAIGAKRAMVLGQLLISASLLAAALSAGLEALLLCRLALGVGTAISLVSGLAFVNSVVPACRKSMAQGIYGGGANMGILLALLFSKQLSNFGGWRGAFLIESLFALAIALLSMARLRSTPPRSHSGPARWRDILRQRSLYLLGLANALTYGSFLAIAAWTATFLWRTHGIDLGIAGPIAAVMAVSAVIGRGVGGALSAGRERQLMVGSCLATAASIGLAPMTPNVVLQVAALLAFGWFSSLPFGAIFSTTSQVSDAASVGRSFGVVTFVSNLGALAFPPIIGYVLDTTASFVLGFGLVAIVCLAGSVALALWLPKGSGVAAAAAAEDLKHR